MQIGKSSIIGMTFAKVIKNTIEIPIFVAIEIEKA